MLSPSIKKIFWLGCFVLVVSCSSVKNNIVIVNDSDTNQPISFNCDPRDSKWCPEKIPQGEKGTFKNVKKIILVQQSNLYEITFADKGCFHLEVSAILNPPKYKNLRHHCQTLKIYGDKDTTINCQTGKPIEQ